MRWLFGLLLTVSVPMLVVGSSLADIGPPVSIQLHCDPKVPEPGVPLKGHVEIGVDADLTLQGFRFAGKGWKTVSLESPAEIVASKGDVYRLDFELLPGDFSKLVEFALEMDGHTVSRSFDLSPESFDRVLTPRKLSTMDEKYPFPGMDTSKWSPGAPPEDSDLVLSPQDSDKGHWIRVLGRLVYHRPDGRILGADNVTVRIYDDDAYDDEQLHSAVYTDWSGHFDVWVYWDPDWNEDSWPDIYVDFETKNWAVVVETTVLEGNYHFVTHTIGDFGGTELDFGQILPDEEWTWRVLQVHNSITRANRWFANAGYVVPQVDVQYPEGDADAAYYTPGFQEIHLGGNRGWLEGSHIHEYGHHWMKNFGDWHDANYQCNGYGDIGCFPEDCDSECASHAMWCVETTTDAVNEGIPHWIADIVTRSFEATYTYPAYNLRDMEDVLKCGSPPIAVHDPNLTEGVFAAVLRDIEDWNNSYNGDAHYIVPGVRDMLALGPDEILMAANNETYASPYEFLLKFKNYVPNYASSYWETAKNCNYELDVYPPGIVTDLVSSTHSTSGDSPNPYVELRWTVAEDDLAGIAGHAIEWNDTGPHLPFPQVASGIEHFWTSPAMQAGDWWFNIRTVDKTGKWSNDYNWIGPITIRNYIPTDLAFEQRAGWYDMVVPRETFDATLNWCPAPTLLPGSAAATYWNFSYLNTGELDWPGTWGANLLVDGERLETVTGSVIPAGTSMTSKNLGPVTVRGGRHTLGVLLDAGHAIPEPNEIDNEYAKQWVWTPTWLDPDITVVRNPPPQRDGGWDAVPGGTPLYYNCDGLSFGSSGSWNAVAINPYDAGYDYDCALYAHTSGAESGFTFSTDQSNFGPGVLDAVIVSGRNMGSLIFDVGVTRNPNFTGDGSAMYEATHVTSQFLPMGSTATLSYGWDEMLKLREFYVDPGDLGPVSVWVEHPPDYGILTVQWLDESFTHGTIADYQGRTTSNEFGEGRLDIENPDPGYHCLVLYRNARNETGYPRDYTLRIDRTPPDLEYVFASGWHSPIVPRVADDGTPANVPLPPLLVGDSRTTYLNYVFRNRSPVSCSAPESRAYIDGTLAQSSTWTTVLPDAYRYLNEKTARTIKGGRHTLSLRLDENERIEELKETNNNYGEQYIWAPRRMIYSDPLSRSTPPDRIGGLEDTLDEIEIPFYNCDGVRTPFDQVYWSAMAVMPGSSSDVDTRLHPRSNGCKDGFADAFAYSAWGRGQSDYSLINYNLTPFDAYDVGILRIEGLQTYTVEAVSSNYLGEDPDGSYGPYQLDAGHILDLHEIFLSAGPLRIGLENLSGDVNWGLTLHDNSSPFLAKHNAFDGGISWFGGPGVDEGFYVDIAQAGFYCLAVWKVANADLPKAGSYRLVFQRGATDAGEPQALPSVTALASIHPNPFNPQTTIAFDLSEATASRLEVLNLRGSRVRTLVDGSLYAGRHEIIWDGRDDHGHTLASGVYVVLLTTDQPQTVTRRKVTLVK